MKVWRLYVDDHPEPERYTSAALALAAANAVVDEHAETFDTFDDVDPGTSDLRARLDAWNDYVAVGFDDPRGLHVYVREEEGP